MSISWLDSGCDGPTDRWRPFESLFIATRYLPYGRLGVAAADDEMADVEVDRDLVEDDLVQVAFSSVGPRRQLPLGDGRLDEQRRVGVALAVVLRVQRAEADRHFAFEDGFVLEDRDAAHVAVEGLAGRSPP